MKLLSILAVLAGCDFYQAPVTHDSCPANEPGHLYRDPKAGTCTYFNDIDCDPSCESCVAPITVQAAMNDSYCEGACEGLGESACRATPDCHVAYHDAAYLGCWETGPWATQHFSDCTIVDATHCAESDTCGSVLTTIDGALTYTACRAL